MKKLLLIPVVIVLFFALGCESQSNADRVLIEEMKEMQREIDALKGEIEKVENTQKTTLQIQQPVQQPQQSEPITCIMCNGSGRDTCMSCRGTGNGLLTCYMCDGTGTDSGGSFACMACKGRGFNTCSSCGGSGIDKCYTCGGSGVW